MDEIMNIWPSHIREVEAAQEVSIHVWELLGVHLDLTGLVGSRAVFSFADSAQDGRRLPLNETAVPVYLRKQAELRQERPVVTEEQVDRARMVINDDGVLPRPAVMRRAFEAAGFRVVLG